MKVPAPRKLKSGSWFIQLRLGGVSVPITALSKMDCKHQAEKIKADYRAGEAVKKHDERPANITVAVAYERYIKAKDGVLSPSTIAGYKRLSQNTMQGLIQKSLSAVTNEAIQLEVSKMAKAEKSRKYIANAVGLLSAVMGMYRPDFRLSVQLPQKVKTEQRRISDSEIAQIMKVVKGSDIELPTLMALWLGMRMSEIRGAKYEDIKKHRLHICRAMVLDSNRQDAIKPPKTFSGDRWVDLPAQIETLIKATGRKEGYIVTASAQAIYKKLCRMCDKAEIEHFRFHDLRHANAAVMVRLGVDSKYAQERNGWNSDAMYKQVYAYAMSDKLADENAAINNYFANKMLNASEKP